eukprot:jgi/Galph1/4189/GphlegSOOS_G2870.1
MSSSRSIQVIGHRGVGKEGLVPQNTLQSFRLCIENGLSYVETDLRVCKSGEVVLMHGSADGNISDSTSGQGKIRDFTLQELKQLEAGNGETIPTLEELLVMIQESQSNLQLNLELKGEEWLDTGTGDHERLIALIERHHMQKRVDFCSFHHEALLYVRTIYPFAKITFLYNYMGQPTPDDFIEKACHGSAGGISMLFHYLTAEQVTAAHQKGLLVTTWMPWIYDDTEKDWMKCIELQVDSAIGFALWVGIDDQMEKSGWNTIESDPAIFTQLLVDLSVKDVQVEEVFQLDATFLQQLQPVIGLIFLFKWIPTEIENYRPTETDKDLFFANQVIHNACGTQALLSVILNAQEEIDIGSELSAFKEFSKDFDPQTRGMALSNSETIRTAHNSLSGLQHFSFEFHEKEASDAFHYVSYVPFRGKVYELDGLKPGPVEVGCYENGNDWINVALSDIQQRIQYYGERELRFNLLAVVKDQVSRLEKEQNDCLQRLEECQDESERTQLCQVLSQIQSRLDEEIEKKQRIRKDCSRRRHNFLPFLIHFLRWIRKNSNILQRFDNDNYTTSSSHTTNNI